MSYGRAVAVFQWVTNNFEYFDSWCCIKNVDPLELPAYRFYNLAIYCMKEHLDEDKLKLFEQQFLACDIVKNPLCELKIKPVKTVLSTTSNEPQSIKPKEKYEYIPPWWQPNEEAAYANAQVAIQGIHKLPKMA